MADWLVSINMSVYKGCFYKHDWKSLARVELATRKELEKMHVKADHIAPIMKAIKDLTANTNLSILGANTGDVKTSIMHALELGDVDSFAQLWSKKLPPKVRDHENEKYQEGQSIEFHARAYLCVSAASEEKVAGAWTPNSQKFSAYLTTIKSSFTGEAQEFALYEQLSKMKTAQEVRRGRHISCSIVPQLLAPITLTL